MIALSFPLQSPAATVLTAVQGIMPISLARLQQDVISQDPWLVIVALGGNDFL